MTLFYSSRQEYGTTTTTGIVCTGKLRTTCHGEYAADICRSFNSSYTDMTFKVDDICDDYHKINDTTEEISDIFEDIDTSQSISDSTDTTNETTVPPSLLPQNLNQSAIEKSVRFAEDKELVEVRMYSPTPPTKFTLSPHIFTTNFLRSRSQRPPPSTTFTHTHREAAKTLRLCFKQPTNQMTHYITNNQSENRLRHQEAMVLVEKCALRMRTVTVLVLVRDIVFEKDVVIRYTTDEWKTCSDIKGFYLTRVEERGFDRFSFALSLPTSSKGMEFAVCFRTSAKEFWDNNDGRNYRVEEGEDENANHQL